MSIDEIVMRSNAYSPIAKLRTDETITPDLIEEVVAGIGIRARNVEKEVYRNIKEVYASKEDIFQSKLPQLSAEVTERINALPAIIAPSPTNDFAVAVARNLAPYGSNGYYWEANEKTALLTGVLVAMEAQLSEATREQKTDKRHLMDELRRSAPGYSLLAAFSGLWASLAKPVGNGTFALERNAVCALKATACGDGDDDMMPSTYSGRFA